MVTSQAMPSSAAPMIERCTWHQGEQAIIRGWSTSLIALDDAEALGGAGEFPSGQIVLPAAQMRDALGLREDGLVFRDLPGLMGQALA
jgi:hypothetical protein